MGPAEDPCLVEDPGSAADSGLVRNGDTGPGAGQMTDRLPAETGEILSRTARRTRQAVLDAALGLFEEKGFDNVSVEEITKRAGVSKGTFYTYFSAKTDIIVEEFLRIDEFYRRYAESRLVRHKVPEEKLMAFTRAQMRYVRDKVGVRNLKVLYAAQTASPGTDKIITNPGRHWVSIVESIIAEGQESGDFRTDMPASRLAALFNRSARAVFLDWCILDASFDLVKEGCAFMGEWIMSALERVPQAR